MGLKDSSECDQCPGGYFCDSPGMQWLDLASDDVNLEDSKKCDAGYFCRPGSTSARPSNGKCPRYNECPVGSSGPIPCKNNFYQPDPEQSACIVGWPKIFQVAKSQLCVMAIFFNLIRN